MHWRHAYRYLLALAIMLAPASSIAQGIGIGSGLDDLHMIGHAGALVPCSTNLVADYTVACNAIDFVMVVY
jgi:hypothetical protein